MSWKLGKEVSNNLKEGNGREMDTHSDAKKQDL